MATAVITRAPDRPGTDESDTTEFNEIVSMLEAIRAPRPRRHVRDIWIGAALLVLVALALGTAWVLDQRTKTTEFTLDDALTELRDTETRIPAPGTTGVSDGGINGATSNPSDAQGTATNPTATPARRSIGAAATAAPVAGMTLPAAGVYTYATSGGEKVSMLGAEHDYPETTHAIITHSGDCGWHIEHRIIEEHVDQFSRCSAAGMFQLQGVSREVEFFSQRDGIDYMCQSPFDYVAAADVPGTTHRAVCVSDHNDRLEMTVTVLERGTRTIAGTTVPTIAYRADWKMTGKATGWARTEVVADATTGLMLQEHRIVDTDANAVFGDVHYSEDVRFNLLSLTPAH
jgi:hypothetical protein